jgi:Polyketide cyclase / dehydrase and lipid transport
MASVGVTAGFTGTVHEAETCWYDNERWPAWVDGLERVVEVDPPWPERGGRIVWMSGPAGRGRVSEKVTAYTPLAGQTVDVDDDSILGRQSVSFIPRDEGVEVRLRLEYQIKRRSIFTPLVDWLFIRRAMESSLRTTLTHFGVELADVRARSRERSDP